MMNKRTRGVLSSTIVGSMAGFLLSPTVIPGPSPTVFFTACGATAGWMIAVLVNFLKVPAPDPRHYARPKPMRFTTGDLLWAVTLISISIGLAAFSILFTRGATVKYGTVVLAIACAAGPAALGAGLFAPFQKKVLGAVVGYFVAVPLFCSGVMLLGG